MSSLKLFLIPTPPKGITSPFRFKMHGIGNDIIEVGRIRKSIERYGQRFLDRVFTPREQAYCLARKDSSIHFAGRFAAKEAVVKALGTGFTDAISWTDIEVVNDAKGKPTILLSDELQLHFDHPTIMISISHCYSYATAMAIWT